MERCDVCETIKADILDGICVECEPLYMSKLSRLAKIVPPETPLSILFERAALSARISLALKNKSKNTVKSTR